MKKQNFTPEDNGYFTVRVNEFVSYSFHRSFNIVRVIKSRKLRWAGHVARMEEGRSVFKILSGKPIGKN